MLHVTFFPVKRNISSRLSVVFSRTLASAGKELKDNFLKALAEREEANRSGKMTVSTLLQHCNCYVMGFPSNISAIPLGWEQNPYCVKLPRNAPPPSTNSMRASCLPLSHSYSFFFHPSQTTLFCICFPELITKTVI